jgi:peptide/nickel transport system permease protein
MTKRLFSRWAWAGVTLWGTSLLVFLIAFVVPADPARAYAGAHADPQAIEDIREELGLNDPLLVQYGRFLGRAVRGDFGRSFITGEEVLPAIWRRFPATLLLALGGLFVQLVLGLPLGILTAKKKDTLTDRTVLVLGMVALSVPVFWLGHTLQYRFAYRWGWLPVAGYGGLAHLILPSITLGLGGAAYYARLVHSNMVDVLQADYVRTARAKGLPESVVLVRHAFRNALIPVLTILGLDLAHLLSGVVFTETVFAWPGIGLLAMQAVLNLDLPMIMGTVLFSAFLVVAANIVVDVIYRFVDPRIGEGT